MAIQDNSDLNNKINNTDNGININGEIDITKNKNCKKCGKPLQYTKTDKDGDFNQNRDREWRLSLCHSCYIDMAHTGQIHDYMKRFTE